MKNPHPSRNPDRNPNPSAVDISPCVCDRTGAQGAADDGQADLGAGVAREEDATAPGAAAKAGRRGGAMVSPPPPFFSGGGGRGMAHKSISNMHIAQNKDSCAISIHHT